MLKRIALLGALASAVLLARRIKVPVEPFTSRLDDPYYKSLLYQSATTPTYINHAAREYLSGIDVPETLRVLAIRVEFPADEDPTTWGDGKMDLRGFGSPSDGLSYDPPHDRTYFENQLEGLRNFYLLNSRGRLVLDFDVYPEEPFRCYEVPHKMAYYGDTSNLDRGLTLFMRDALLAADEDPDIDFSRYHYTHQGNTFDMILVFHAGSTIQSSLFYGYVSDLASATVTPGALLAYTGREYVSMDDGTQIRTASIVPESPRVEGVMTGLPGILYHEFTHLLGGYDLYDVTGYTQGVGAWSLMGGGGWLGYPPGQIPSLHDAYHRYLFGWENPIVVESDTTISLYAAEFDTLLIPSWQDSLRPTLALVPIRYDRTGEPQEYFLIENRQTDVKAVDTVEVDVKAGVPIWIEEGEYDAFQPGSGMIIWHVDEDLVDQWGSYNLINAWTAFGKHNAVDMEEGDGIQDYELLYYESSGAYASQGSEFDPYFTGGQDLLDEQTEPSSRGYYGESGISIQVLDPSDTLMRVKISFAGSRPGFPQKSQWLAGYNSLLILDVDSDGEKEILGFGAKPGRRSYAEAWNADGSTFSSPYISYSDSLAAPAAAADLSGDGEDEIVLVGYEGRISVFDSLSQDNPGSIDYYLGSRSFTPPMLADLDADGDGEIICADEYGEVHALDYASDSLFDLAGFSLDAGEEIRPGFALADKDPVLIVMLTTSGRLYLFDASGDVGEGFPLELGQGSAQNLIPPVVADADGDGEPEIIAFVFEYNRYRYFFISLEGEVEYRSTRTFQAPITSPALADLDSDGLPEVLFGSANRLWGLDVNGAVVEGFPVVFPEYYLVEEPYVYGGYLYFITFEQPFNFTSTPLVADFDTDGEPEMALGSPDHGIHFLNIGEREPYSTVYTRHGVGKGFSLEDIDDDGTLELVTGTIASSDTLRGSIHVTRTSAGSSAWGHWMHDQARTGLLAEEFKAPASPTAPISDLYVYPNPARYQAYLHVTLGQVQNLRLDLLDISGKLISSLEPPFDPEMTNDIPLEDLLEEASPGLYILRAEAIGEGKSTVELYKLGILK